MQAKNFTLENFARRVAMRKEQLGASVEQIAQVCAVKPGAVYKWLKGSTAPGSLELFRLATFFSVPMEWLLGIERSPDEMQAMIDSNWKMQIDRADEKYQALKGAMKDVLKKF